MRAARLPQSVIQAGATHLLYADIRMLRLDFLPDIRIQQWHIPFFNIQPGHCAVPVPLAQFRIVT